MLLNTSILLQDHRILHFVWDIEFSNRFSPKSLSHSLSHMHAKGLHSKGLHAVVQ